MKIIESDRKESYFQLNIKTNNLKIVLYFDTLKHLRFKQILFQIIYRIKYPFHKIKVFKKIKNINILNWENIIENENTFLEIIHLNF